MSPQYSRRDAIQRGLLVAGGACVGLAALRNPPYALAQPAPTVQLAKADLDFAFRLFTLLAGPATQNTFISPLSVSIALSMVASGARGSTARAITSALGLSGMSMADLGRASTALIRDLGNRDPKVNLAIADSLWARQGLAVQPQFVQTLKSAYGAEVASLNFADPHASATINGWVNRKTHGLIPSIVTTIPADAVLYLINALYFKADWAQQFPTRSTTLQPFTRLNGTPLQVPMMSTRGEFPYYRGANYELIGLPYGNGKMSMYIMLPAAGPGFAGFQKGLTPQTWNAALARLTTRQGNIALPRFTVSYGASLVPALSALGMGVAFGAGANFSGMLAGASAAISQVLHKAVMKVYEAGTTAAAVTGAIMATAAMPNLFSMNVDRPFFCAIRDDTTGTLLFMGSIVDPR
jgi:serine protease inhibitor